MKVLTRTILILCLFWIACIGCNKDEKLIVVTQTEYVYLRNAALPDPGSGLLGINYVVQPDTYATHTGSIPAGSLEVVPGVITQIQAGVPWFDLTSIPSGITVVSAKLVLTVNAAPVTAINVEVRDLAINPLTINGGDPLECQGVYDDACAGEIYATFDVDSSQTIVEVILSSQAILDIQSAVDGSIGFGVGLRAPTADAGNIIDVSFFNDAYMEIGYQQ